MFQMALEFIRISIFSHKYDYVTLKKKGVIMGRK